MAREPVPLGGFQGEALLVPALHDGMVGEHVVEWLRNDLDSRLTVLDSARGQWHSARYSPGPPFKMTGAQLSPSASVGR